ncbi:BCL-6 corepressor isoform X2 [Pristis pectinata]|uniref:BCL-6 corepressor isoform X2 n=4 Tax=Pristis pectinata TaxID=685728 RepID=UPI00223CFEF4|nr:BCL-6 corepressor isoform X2 [Pristis pectinata]
MVISGWSSEGVNYCNWSSPVMLATASLYNGIHDWTQTDCIRMCGIKEDRSMAHFHKNDDGITQHRLRNSFFPSAIRFLNGELFCMENTLIVTSHSIRRSSLTDAESRKSAPQLVGTEDTCINNHTEVVTERMSNGVQQVEGLESNLLQEGLQNCKDNDSERSVPKEEEVALMTTSDAQLKTDRIANVESKLVHGEMPENGDNKMKNLEIVGMNRKAQQPQSKTTCTQDNAGEPGKTVKEKLTSGSEASYKGIPWIDPQLDSATSGGHHPFNALSSLNLYKPCLSASQNLHKVGQPYFSPVFNQGPRLMYLPAPSLSHPHIALSLSTTIGVTGVQTVSSFSQSKAGSPNLAPDQHSYSHPLTLSRPLTSEPKAKHAADYSHSLLVKTKAHSEPPQKQQFLISPSHTSSPSPHIFFNLGSELSLSRKNSNSQLPKIAARSPTHQPSLGLSENSQPPFMVFRSPPQLEKQIYPEGSHDLPLDLSAKSSCYGIGVKQNSLPELRKTPPMPVLTPVKGDRSFSLLHSKSDGVSPRIPQSGYNTSSIKGSFGLTPPFMVFPDTIRNGATLQKKPVAPLTFQPSNPTVSWVKSSSSSVNRNPRTFVGVANAIPASMLQIVNGDPKGAAKQEPISIVYQGDSQLALPNGKKNGEPKNDAHEDHIVKESSNHSHNCFVSSSSEVASYPPPFLIGGSIPVNHLSLGKDKTPFHHSPLLTNGSCSAPQLSLTQGIPYGVSSSRGEYTLFQSPHHLGAVWTPHKIHAEKMKEDQLQTMGSPLSNLESIVQNTALELFAVENKKESPKSFSPNAISKEGVPSKDLNQPASNCANIVDLSHLPSENQNKSGQKDQQNTLSTIKMDKMGKANKGVANESCKNSTGGVGDDEKVHNKELEIQGVITSLPLSKQPFINQSHNHKDLPVAELQSDRNLEVVAIQELASGSTTSSILSTDADQSMTKGMCNEKERCTAGPVKRTVTKEKDGSVMNPVSKCKGPNSVRCNANPSSCVGEKFKCTKKEDIVSSNRLNREEQTIQGSKRRSSSLEVSQRESEEDVCSSEGHDGERRSRRLRTPKTESPSRTAVQDRGRTDFTLKKGKNSFKDFIPVVLKTRTRSQSESHCGTSVHVSCDQADISLGESQRMQEVVEDDVKKNSTGQELFKTEGKETKEESEVGRTANLITEVSEQDSLEPRDLSCLVDTDGNYKANNKQNPTIKTQARGNRKKFRNEVDSEVSLHRGEKNQDGIGSQTRKTVTTVFFLGIWTPPTSSRKRLAPSTTLPNTDWNLSVRHSTPVSGSVRKLKEPCSPGALNLSHIQESPSEYQPEKPSGKRKCKTKHISGPLSSEEGANNQGKHKIKVKQKRSLKRLALMLDSDWSPSPKKKPDYSVRWKKKTSSVTPVKHATGSRSPSAQAETSTGQQSQSETRKLIVNKNAGETLLQKAARLGYEDVVIYCLENEVCDINHRDNAGYTALHEASARGWLDIVTRLLEHGADVNCSAQDGTRPIHDAVVNDNLDVVHVLLSYGADPTLATYSGQTVLKMTHSEPMEHFLIEYFTDLRGRSEDDPALRWEFYGSSACEQDKEIVCNILANPPGLDEEEDEDTNYFVFEFSEKPLLACYNIQASLSHGPCNWLVLSEVLRRLKMSVRIFQSRYPHFEIVTITEVEFYKQVSTSQVHFQLGNLQFCSLDGRMSLELVRCVPELLDLIGSTVELLTEDCEKVIKFTR